MKKVTIVMGSPRKRGATYTAARIFADHLESLGDVEAELVNLTDYDIGACRGCKVCFERGEERCPLKDDRDVLIAKLEASDGVVFAVPNYMWQVPGVMKVFIDRLAFMGHRPRFHGKVFTSVVVQGIGMGGRIVKYLDFTAGTLGLRTVKGSCSRTLAPMTEEARRTMDRALARQSRRFHAALLRPAFRAPSLFELMMFRMARTGVEAGTAEDSRDRAYYGEQGWFDSDYYYPTRLGPFKRTAGAFFDWAALRLPIFKVASGPEPSNRPSPAESA